MKRITVVLVLALCISGGCVNIAPDEQWDGDDTRIWIKEASLLNLDPFWFAESSSNLDSTILEYKQEYEKEIATQIVASAHFNEHINFDSTVSLKKDSSLGVWMSYKDGFIFRQFKGNQYPMTIIVDTVNNKIKSVASNGVGKSQKITKANLQIAIEVVPEGDSSYSIAWKDTVGQSKGYDLSDRPFEGWCVLKDRKDTVGYYKGLSTPAAFTYFTTTDSVITAQFMIGPNLFSNVFSEEEKKVYEGYERVIEFNPINLNIKNDLRKTLNFVLTEK